LFYLVPETSSRAFPHTLWPAEVEACDYVV
jgi:hypothetical protein